MSEHHVTNATKSGPGLERITHLSGPGWGPYDVLTVVALIKTGSEFYTKDPVFGRKAPIEVIEASPPYVRTYANVTQMDNLLSLPPCP